MHVYSCIYNHIHMSSYVYRYHISRQQRRSFIHFHVLYKRVTVTQIFLRKPPCSMAKSWDSCNFPLFFLCKSLHKETMREVESPKTSQDGGLTPCTFMPAASTSITWTSREPEKLRSSSCRKIVSRTLSIIIVSMVWFLNQTSDNYDDHQSQQCVSPVGSQALRL